MTPWQICITNLTPRPRDLMAQVAEHKATRPGTARPNMLTIREQSDKIVAMLTEGDMTTAGIADALDLSEKLVVRRLARLREDGRIVKRTANSNRLPFRTHWWRLP